MESHKRTSSTAGNDTRDQPPAKQLRPTPTAAQWPRCIYIVERTKRPRTAEEDEGERTNIGVFVSLANANREVRREMAYFASEWGTDGDDDLGDHSIFDEGSDEYAGIPPAEGEKVGSSWEFDDQTEEIHYVGVTAYPLIWPEDYVMTEDEESEIGGELDDEGDYDDEEDGDGEEDDQP
ncbi:hypothetical protein UCRPA7_7127 [Phaeoacremonium minimum UCRPA7]|uniref:Uncharacterized protein n=1 Tax=Phaeoacremonium minimum (strain UCR-PA7) TaxID=1286976 RepID=R8BDI8_PHAM7|nr:hypothetical protein UCRPA7_7127 [Phaeoacremonium minimum UCRPA7]EON97366.1 hypothetical protein UCRPA7_7127 [Phaeoacremonium minimum UCRPA7]